MLPFITSKIWIISSSIILGSLYGVVAALSQSNGIASLQEMAVSAVCGAALLATAGSVLCRVTEIGQIIRESKNRPSDPDLYYRGLRNSRPFFSTTFHSTFDVDHDAEPVCGDGVRVISHDSSLEDEHESHELQDEHDMCYQAVHQ